MAIAEKSAFERVAERIVARYLTSLGRADVQVVSGFESLGGRGVDVSYAWQSARRGVKVKADAYFGTDPVKIADRNLPFYRADMNCYAFEAVANAATREPGWIFESASEELYYYFLALGQAEDELKALLAESDDVLFSELKVERDNLVLLPMAPTRDWFEANYDRYTPRPVMAAGVSAWYRLVPRADIDSAVAGIKNIGPVFAALPR
jgi:hypothetical protein